MEQYSKRRRMFWLFTGVSVIIICTAAFVLLFAGIRDRDTPFSQETAQAETVNEQNRAEALEGQRESWDGFSEAKEGEGQETADGENQEKDLPAGIPGRQVTAREEGYCLVSENGFLFVFAKDKSAICLDTHMPLSEFPLTEQERLLDGLWFSSMMEVLHYLESYTS